uniref:Uncharacterized protein n=1 Tax=Dulem virus 40 TaxID=3145758 RepID=A0AAU8AUS1_9CAUD
MKAATRPCIHATVDGTCLLKFTRLNLICPARIIRCHDVGRAHCPNYRSDRPAPPPKGTIKQTRNRLKLFKWK